MDLSVIEIFGHASVARNRSFVSLNGARLHELQRGLLRWQRNYEGGSFSWFALHGDIAAVLSHDSINTR